MLGLIVNHKKEDDMPVVYNEKDFQPDVWAENSTVGAMLAAIDTNPDNHIIYRRDEDVTFPTAPSESDNAQESRYFLSALEPDEAKPCKVAGVFLVGAKDGNHYVGAVFDKKPGENGKLTLIDTLGEVGKSSYSDRLNNIQEVFKRKFGKDIKVELNPPGKVLYQNDGNSCAFTCKYTVEHLLREKEIEENSNLGIYRSGNDELRCEAGAGKLRERELRIIEYYGEVEQEVAENQGSELDKKNLISGMMQSFIEEDDRIHSGKETTPERVVDKALELMTKEPEKVDELAGKILDSKELTEHEKDFLIREIADSVENRQNKNSISREELKAITDAMRESLSSNQKGSFMPPKPSNRENGLNL